MWLGNSLSPHKRPTIMMRSYKTQVKTSIAAVGQRFAYRKRARAVGEPVQPVEVVKEGPPRSGKVRIRYLSGEYQGFEEWVPKVRLVAAWDEAEAFCKDELHLLAAHKASGEADGTVPFEAAQEVFYAINELFREELILSGWKKLERDLVIIRNFDATVHKLRLNRKELVSEFCAFVDRHGDYWAPSSTAERLARLFCQRFPREILRHVQAREDEWRQRTILPSEPFSEGFALEWLNKLKPVFALVREWCGEKDVAEFDEVTALREEVRRLRGLVESVARWLQEAGHPIKASLVLRELNDTGGHPKHEKVEHKG